MVTALTAEDLDDLQLEPVHREDEDLEVFLHSSGSQGSVLCFFVGVFFWDFDGRFAPETWRCVQSCPFGKIALTFVDGF